MQFKHVLCVALLTAITGATAVPKVKIPCDNAYHPCNRAGKYPDCSKEYIKQIELRADAFNGLSILCNIVTNILLLKFGQLGKVSHAKLEEWAIGR
ncbi:unnamed protein product [Tuber aestivum]|uniref:Extracellular membrane protein CFEM domain-containing protein n=1 Tax=Tuber aestivum TaxID=59557 RepID=A0A292PK47_9PEZI|nr:unnamed protein product [Tuber aestivum]